MSVGVGELAIVVLCVFLSAFFSSSEAAFLSVRGTAKLAHLVKEGVPAAGRVSRMLDEPGRLLSTILLGNNLVNVAFTALVTALILDAVTDENTGIIIATVVGTLVLLIFGEVLPKTAALRFPMGTAMTFTRPLRAVELALWPLVVVLQSATRIAEIGGRDGEDPSVTEAEVRTLIDIGEEEGELEPSEVERLERVFRFGDRQAREVMTPRTEIAFVNRSATLGEFLEIYADHSHTRFPAYKGTTEDIVGIFSAKDILRTLSTRTMGHDEPITDLIRDVYFVPETQRIADLFEGMRQGGNQIAIVIDEFGGVAGLVTLKSLLEEVVGRVGEEGASPEEEYEALGKDTFQVDGAMSTEEAEAELGIELPKGDFETVAGFVLDRLGHIPTEGEQFEYGNLKVEVAKMNGLRIETVKLTRVREGMS